jgi:hypothetical protein
MIMRRDSLEQALREIEAGTLPRSSTIVVNLDWWNGLSSAVQETYRHRAEGVAADLRADEQLSRHYVEVRSGEEGPPLSTERPM